MARYEAQAVLFAPRPSRLALLSLHVSNASTQGARINVWRNHAFEPIQPLMDAFFAYRGWKVDFQLGSYDDSLGFAGRQAADLDLVWLDRSRLRADGSPASWLPWLKDRLRFLRSTTTVPILLATWGQEAVEVEALQTLVDELPSVYFCDLAAASAKAGAELLDARSARLSGTPLGKTAQLILARELACHWLPAALLPPVKAIALDLDNTLHKGVLGEDGVQGVQLSAGHEGLQKYIKELSKKGIFLALVSRNNYADVEALFTARADYALRWDDFSTVEISWSDKASALERIAKALRISPDAILFVDDNPGELASVASHLPAVHTVFAHEDAFLTRDAIHYYPGLWRWKTEADDGKRIQDLKASAERETLAATVTDPADYFRSLQVSLAYCHSPEAHFTRLADLCGKTNQFNLAMRRFNHAALAEHLASPRSGIACVTLSDRLADSGIIAVMVASREEGRLMVEEVCISCRAMGRQLEDTIILVALRNMPVFAGCTEVVFSVEHGPRNQPALDWLARLLGMAEAPAPGLHMVPAQRLTDFVAGDGITLTKE